MIRLAQSRLSSLQQRLGSLRIFQTVLEISRRDQIDYMGELVAQFFLPTSIGNVIRATLLVAALGHAQVVEGKK